MANTQPNESGTPLQVTTSALGTIGAGNPVNLLGILMGSGATANQVNLWTQTGAVLTGQPVVTNLTIALNTFVRVPGYFNKGLTYQVPNDAPNLTIFWNPAG